MASAHIPMWNIDASVGKHQVNRQDDVRLVQSMLIALAAGGAFHSKVQNSNFLPGAKLLATGMFDDLTGAAIKVFQDFMNQKYPGKYPSDGVVTPLHSPERIDWTARTPNGKNSTMVGLNFELRAVDKALHQSLGEKLKERVP